MTLITNRRVLQTEIPPDEILLRDAKLDHLQSVLEPIRVGEPVDGAFIHGPPGTGKSHSARLMVSRLQQAAGQITTTHIDCWQFHTTTAIVSELLAALGVPAPDNAAGYELLKRLRDDLEQPVVVILDEADQIEEDRVLYELHSLSRVTPILIANDYSETLDGLDMRVESRVSGYAPIEFSKYSSDQLATILERRIELGVRPGAVPDDVVGEIVDVSRNDARKAINNLRKSLDRASAEGRDNITREIVRAVAPEVERELRRKTFSKLTRKQRVLYEILVEDGGEMPIGEIYDQFCERFDSGDRKMPQQKTAQRHLKKLSHYDIVGYSGENSARRYWSETDELLPEKPA